MEECEREEYVEKRRCGVCCVKWEYWIFVVYCECDNRTVLLSSASTINNNNSPQLTFFLPTEQP